MDAPVTRSAVAPDVGGVYALHGRTLPGIDPRMGRTAALAALPGTGLGLAAGARAGARRRGRRGRAGHPTPGRRASWWPSGRTR